jgi:hypothetical protein
MAEQHDIDYKTMRQMSLPGFPLFDDLSKEKQVQAPSRDFAEYLEALKKDDDEVVKFFLNYFERTLL